MKPLIPVFYFCMLCMLGVLPNTLLAQSALETGFNHPPSTAKARTWWHWVNGNVTKEGITADLEAMHRVGIQEAQIFDVDFGYPQGPATFLSPAWMDLFQFAVKEAKRLGMEIGFNNGAGWSSSGGPWVQPEDAMQTVVYSQIEVKGGQAIHHDLPQPPTKLGYYQEIAVIAFPTPKSDIRIDALPLKALSGHSFRTHMAPDGKTIDPAAVIQKSSIINLTGKMSPDGTLNWKALKGDWTILRMGYTPIGTENHPTGPGGRGLECDKMSKAAVDAYWKGGVQPVLDKVGDLAGSTLSTCLIDSYEVGCSNWTKGFRDAFKRRRGYDLFTFLPTLAGYYVESGSISERFLWDFRKTISDLMVDNYYGHFLELCHENGLKFSVEPYGGPFDDLKAGATGDIVMGEFWMGKDAYLESPRLAASIAHVNGQSIVGAESFTSFGGWLNHPATLKGIGDQAWTEGVNRLIFHSYVHQPWNKPPGFTFQVYGIEMNRLNTWWEQSKRYMNYIARSQFLLQQGRNVADVLVFSGESSPNDAILRPDIKALGYDYDQIDREGILSLTVKDGQLYTLSGGKYQVLILPDSDYATPELLLKIKALVKAGAVVKGSAPQQSPSLTGYPACDKQVANLSAEIWGNGTENNARTDARSNYVTSDTLADILTHLQLPPDFSAGPTGSDLHFIHRVKDGQDIYFVANPAKTSRQQRCNFRIVGKKPTIWDPETGKIKDAIVWHQNADGTLTIPLSFDSQESLFIIFEDRKKSPADHIIATSTRFANKNQKALPGLEVLRAEYGIFLPGGMEDVTDALQDSMTQDDLMVFADNRYGSGDPAPGSIKELRVAYELNGRRHTLRLLENEHQIIPTANHSFKLIRALYGKFPQSFGEIPPKYAVKEVTDRVSELISKNELVFAVSDRLFGGGLHEIDATSDPNEPQQALKKELRIDYIAAGVSHQISVPTGRLINLAVDQPAAKLVEEKGISFWETPYTGSLQYQMRSGKEKTVSVKQVPSPIELSGSWELQFPDSLSSPTKTQFSHLMSWTESASPDIRYFSGTATYTKSFTLPESVFEEDVLVELDLGRVDVIAEVILNGHHLGVLWKAPFRVDLEKVAHKGSNKLEIQVTNLWPNRLIGEEQLPADMQWKNGAPVSWPKWLLDNQATNTSKRSTFTTYQHYHKDAELLPSGLLGPVILRFYKKVKL